VSKDQRLYLRDILERIDRIEETARQGEALFRQSYMHQDTIIRSFEVIGEIIKRLEPELLTQQPHIQWADYAGFRDILIHQYDQGTAGHCLGINAERPCFSPRRS
jgi:uncharacterized protein with HEPN domain